MKKCKLCKSSDICFCIQLNATRTIPTRCAGGELLELLSDSNIVVGYS